MLSLQYFLAGCGKVWKTWEGELPARLRESTIKPLPKFVAYSNLPL